MMDSEQQPRETVNLKKIFNYPSKNTVCNKDLSKRKFFLINKLLILIIKFLNYHQKRNYLHAETRMPKKNPDMNVFVLVGIKFIIIQTDCINNMIDMTRCPLTLILTKHKYFSQA